MKRRSFLAMLGLAPAAAVTSAVAATPAPVTEGRLLLESRDGRLRLMDTGQFLLDRGEATFEIFIDGELRLKNTTVRD